MGPEEISARLNPLSYIYMYFLDLLFFSKPLSVLGLQWLRKVAITTIFYLKTFQQRSFFLSHRNEGFLKNSKRKKVKKGDFPLSMRCLRDRLADFIFLSFSLKAKEDF